MWHRAYVKHLEDALRTQVLTVPPFRPLLVLRVDIRRVYMRGWY